MSFIPEDLPPRLEEDGKPGPYSESGLKSVVGTLQNPLAKNIWYNQEGTKKISSPGSPVITYAYQHLAQGVAALGGLDPDWRITQPNPAQWPLSKVIPRVKLGPKFPDWPIPKGTYWIDYETVTASTTKLPSASWIPSLRERFPEGSTLLLGNIGNYASRLALWQFRNQIWDHELLKQVDAVVCPDFSSYLDDPFPQGVVGERMTQTFVKTGFQKGKTMIPILSWQNRDSLLRQADYLMSLYPEVHTVYVELLAREVDKGAWLFSRFDDLQELKHMPFRFLFSGLDAGWAVREAKSMFEEDNFHLISIWPWMKTSFTPGTPQQKARSFRKFVHQFEDFHSGENLPKPKPRPEDMTILKWQLEEKKQNP